MPYRTATSVYLRPAIPWLRGIPASDRFAVARLAYDRTTGEYAWGGNGPARILRRLALSQPFPDPDKLLAAPADWIGDGPGVRAAIVHSTRMGAHEIGAGLMSHQRSQITEWAEQALPEGLRRAPKLSRSQAGPTTPSNPRITPSTDAGKKAEQARAARARRIALAVATQVNMGLDPVIPPDDPTKRDAAATPPTVRARLLWQTPSLRDAAIRALAEILGLEGDGRWPEPAHTQTAYDNAEPGNPTRLVWHTPELTLELRCLRLTRGLADTLGINPKARPRGRALAAAIAARRQVAKAFLEEDGAHPDQPELALVEIDRRQDYDHSLDDPKFALRLGCADAGVLTQFVLVPKKAKHYNSEKNLDHRVQSGWQDGLRQLGVRVLPEHAVNGLPEKLRYVATWMVKRRKDGPTRLPRHTPVAVMVSPLAKGSGLAAVTGWDPESLRWIPYPKFLLRLVKIAEIPDVDLDDESDSGSLDSDALSADAVPQQRDGTLNDAPAGAPRRVTYRVWKQNMDEQRKDTARYLQKMIRSLRGHPTVLLTHSQNNRMHWPWLQDGQTELDLIKTGHAPAAGLDADLRLVRLRDADGRETPQWWGNPATGGINGLPPGLWVEKDDAGPVSGRIFYSTTAKAGTFKKSAVEADKLAPRPLRQGENKGKPTIDTEIPAWNPALIEIAVLACHPHQGDVPEALALAVHHLRQAPDYLDALSMPLPLHLASLAQHYVLPTIADEETAVDTEPDHAIDRIDMLETTLGVVIGSPVEEEADLDPESSDAPGLAQAPDESDETEELALLSSLSPDSA